jgi:oligopeptide/dipeptide ABC transporter, ATP-binding protein, C-terminal domain
MQEVLRVENLTVRIGSRNPLEAVTDVSFTLTKGECFALVGESGCGKSLTALSLMRLLPEGVHAQSGKVILSGTDLMALTEGEMQSVRGAKIAMIFQEPATSLNPVMTVGDQIVEAVRLHEAADRKTARARALEWLRRVGLDEPERRLSAFPHELSGGQKQRVMIAMALACEPDVLVADEPTTALDVTRQAQILDLLKELGKEKGVAILLITHDLALVRRYADRVALMYAGNIVESAPVKDFFERPLHPYAQLLLSAVPSADKSGRTLTGIAGAVPDLSAMPAGCRFAPRCPLAEASCGKTAPMLKKVALERLVRCPKARVLELSSGRALEFSSSSEETVLKLTDVSVTYEAGGGLFSRKKAFEVVRGVTLELKAGRTLALVGESGSGKTTLAKAALGLLTDARVTGGVEIAGSPAFDARGRFKHPLRAAAQIVFQDPFASLDPRMSVGELVAEGILAVRPETGKDEAKREVARLLERVGLPSGAFSRLAHEFSGGQRQRIAIARALAVRPRLVVCDESTSALDVSVQAQILNLLRQIQAEEGVSYLFITHNFAVVEFMAHEAAVMRKGQVVEQGKAAQILTHPQHPYTRELLSAVPRL